MWGGAGSVVSANNGSPDDRPSPDGPIIAQEIGGAPNGYMHCIGLFPQSIQTPYEKNLDTQIE